MLLPGDLLLLALLLNDEVGDGAPRSSPLDPEPPPADAAVFGGAAAESEHDLSRVFFLGR